MSISSLLWDSVFIVFTECWYDIVHSMISLLVVNIIFDSAATISVTMSLLTLPSSRPGTMTQSIYLLTLQSPLSISLKQMYASQFLVVLPLQHIDNDERLSSFANIAIIVIVLDIDTVAVVMGMYVNW